MNDKIIDIYNKTKTLIENECFGTNKEFQYHKIKNSTTPIRKEKMLLKVLKKR